MSASARSKPDAREIVRVFLCGDVMMGRGIDQILPHPCNPELHEDWAQSASDYVRLAEQVNGRIPTNVAPSYIWGAALNQLNQMRPDARVINLETSITRSDAYISKGINYRMSPENAECLLAAGIDCCVLGNNHVLDWQRAGLLETLGWSPMVRDYLMGDRRPMIDLTAWNADATRMPCRMHSEYLRRLFLNNDLAEGRFEVDGKPVSLRDIHVPLFAVSTIADHVAPWRSVYKIQMLTGADVTFVLSNGGHNAGVVNPPGHPNRHHQIATHKEIESYVDLGAWQASAVHHEGSWWPCWLDWLERLSGTKSAPPPMGGTATAYAPLCDAPGTYVLEP
jgi:hypothetical protein